MKLKYVAMLGDVYLRTNEVSVERAGGRREAWNETAADDLMVEVMFTILSIGFRKLQFPF